MLRHKKNLANIITFSRIIGVVFILWGAFAQKKKPLIDSDRHYVIETPHPSPLSAHRGFFGSRPFSRTNDALLEAGRSGIDWALPHN